MSIIVSAGLIVFGVLLGLSAFLVYIWLPYISNKKREESYISNQDQEEVKNPDPNFNFENPLFSEKSKDYTTYVLWGEVPYPILKKAVKRELEVAQALPEDAQPKEVQAN